MAVEGTLVAPRRAPGTFTSARAIAPPGQPMNDEPHSAAYFDAERDFWFHADWLDLLAARLGLSEVRRALDVGAGQGHWTLLLASRLRPEAKIEAIEREPEWVRRATGRVTAAGLSDRVRFRQGEAERLPYDDGTFELVTCQTVLMHVANAAAVLAEMARVTRPGGLVLVSEPNNAAGMLVSSTADRSEPLERRIERLEFLLRCQQGKAALGEGDGAVADVLPALMRDAGLVEIAAFVNDRTDLLLAPYEDEAQRALRDAIVSGADDDHWIGWGREEAQRMFVAGGGDPETFPALWSRRLEEAQRDATALREMRMEGAGGRIHYLIAGRAAWPSH